MRDISHIVIQTILLFELGFLVCVSLALFIGHLKEKKLQRPHKALMDVVRACVKLVLAQLKLKKKITVRFRTEYDNCDFNTLFGVTFGIKYLLKILENDYAPLDELIMFPLLNKYDRLYFVVAHEIAHAYQYHKYRKWFYRFHKKKRKKKTTTNAEYVKLKIEHNANKIARILLARYKKLSVPYSALSGDNHEIR